MSMFCEVAGCRWGDDGGCYKTPSSLDSDRKHLDMLALHVTECNPHQRVDGSFHFAILGSDASAAR